MKLAELLATDGDELAAREHVKSLMRDARGRGTGAGKTSESESTSSLGIIGAGIMGRAVAAAALGGGLHVAVTDVNADALAAAKTGIIGELIAAGKSDDEARGLADRLLRITSESAEVAACDLVLESVAENPRIKQQVYAEIEPLLSERAILATNTSTIPIRELAMGLKRPERFCGAHFFHPVRERPLLEIIHGPKTDPKTVATARGFAASIRKMPIVVEDGPGFLVNRLLLPYVTEAMELLLDGVDIHTIERVATEFGMAKGPLQLLDEIGLDTALQGGWVLSAAFPERTVSSPLLVAMIKAKNLGTKTGCGFFDHSGGRKGVRNLLCEAPEGPFRQKVPDTFSLPIAEGVPELIEKWKRDTPDSASPPDDSIVLARLLLTMILEATRLLEDGTVGRPEDIDLGVLFGLGFPIDRGGLLWWADRLGAGPIVKMLGEIKGLGTRVQPTEMLLKMAAESRTFYQ
ncbi:MAG: hypothetical protein JXM70_05540 [Pirellulales bacterium]|nr:hypothetical protein [Pirellulales bacterium]